MRLQPLVVFAALTSASAAYADGCYIPERAIRKIPEIVSQDAILSWKDGVETLVISSTLDSEAQSLGWIVPLPATPTTLKKATPGLLKTLDYRIQPDITHDLWPLIKLTLIAAFVINLVVGVALFKTEGLPALLFWLFVLFGLWSLLLPAGGTSGRETAVRASGIRVEKTAEVGAYTVKVLRPEVVENLNDWLAENELAPLPDAARSIAAQYISQNWVFAAITLRRDASGKNAPHPIKLVFPSKEAVYPMKLTALAGGKPEFALFVIGDQRASCDALRVEFCDRFSLTEGEDEDEGASQPMFLGESSRCTIGHPGVRPLMWKGCVLTKLVGSIDSANMTEDLQISWKPFAAFQEHFFTRRGARDFAALLFLLSVGVLTFIFLILVKREMRRATDIHLHRNFRSPRERERSHFGRILAAVACAVLLPLGVYVCVPKIGDADVQTGGHFYASAYGMSKDLDASIQAKWDILARPQQEIANYLLQRLRGNRWENDAPVNETTGSKLTLEDSPGNFTVERQANQVIVRTYYLSGCTVTKAYKGY